MGDNWIMMFKSLRHQISMKEPPRISLAPNVTTRWRLCTVQLFGWSGRWSQAVETGDVFASSRVSGRNNDMDTTHFFRNQVGMFVLWKLILGFQVSLFVLSIYIYIYIMGLSGFVWKWARKTIGESSFFPLESHFGGISYLIFRYTHKFHVYVYIYVCIK